MSLEEPTPAVAQPDRRSLSFDLSNLPSAGTAIGVGLLSSAVLVAALHTRESFDVRLAAGANPFDLSVYLVGLAAVLGLLGMAVAGLTLERITEPTAVSWPGTAGALGAGLLLAVAIGTDPAALYAGAAVALGLCLVGLAVTKAAPFAVGGLAAFTVTYIQAIDDLFGHLDFDGTEGFVAAGAAITAYVIGVSVAGWFLRDNQALIAVLAGVGGLVAMVMLFMGLVFTGMLSAAFSSSEAFPSEEYSSGSGSVDSSDGDDFACASEFDEDSALDEDAMAECFDDEFSEDEFSEDGFDDEFEDEGVSFEDEYLGSSVKGEIYTILGFALLLAGFWTAFGMATGHVAFRILVLADAAIMVPAATMALVVRQPTWWEVALIVLGGLVLLLASGTVRRRGSSEPPAELPAQ